LGTVNFLVNDQQKHGLKEIKDSTKRENSQVGRSDCKEKFAKPLNTLLRIQGKRLALLRLS
jgi:hypothetical protein